MTDEELMRAALDEAREAAALGEVPVGAVVARTGKSLPGRIICARAAKMLPTTPS